MGSGYSRRADWLFWDSVGESGGKAGGFKLEDPSNGDWPTIRYRRKRGPTAILVAVSYGIQAPDYPGRAELVGGMLPVLKAARRPLAPELERFGLDRDGWHHLDVLENRLVRHGHFEHLGREKIRDAIQEGALRYREVAADQRTPARQFAAEVLDAMAQEPMRRTVYLGVEHLRLPHGTVVGDVRFVELSNDPDLTEAFARFGDSAPELVCEVEVIAGTDDLLRERARDTAETALGLIRQQNLFGFNVKIYLDQIIYGLDGRYIWRDGTTIARAGWWRHKPHPTPMDLAHPNGTEWRAKLAELAELYSAVAPGLRPHVDTCIDWLDVAALSDRWRIIIPAIFSGMEALLVPETIGLKAEVVTVRSVAVHVADGHGFFDPGEIIAAYQLRSDLIHGNPTPEILDKDATDFADFRRLWAFRVLCDYLALAKSIGATKVRDIVPYLDDGKCNDVCVWLEQHGGSAVVAQYRKVASGGPTSPNRTPSREVRATVILASRRPAAAQRRSPRRGPVPPRTPHSVAGCGPRPRGIRRASPRLRDTRTIDLDYSSYHKRFLPRFGLPTMTVPEARRMPPTAVR